MELEAILEKLYEATLTFDLWNLQIYSDKLIALVGYEKAKEIFKQLGIQIN